MLCTAAINTVSACHSRRQKPRCRRNARVEQSAGATLRQMTSCPVAAIQVVQVVRCTRASDPWGPTSEDQITIF